MDDVFAPPLAADALDLGALTSSLGFLLRIAQVKNFENFYAALADHGLRPGEFSVLMVMHRNVRVRQGVLAQRLMIKRAHMTKLIRALEDRGLVERTIPDDDRRSVELSLTPKGHEFVENNLGFFQAFEEINAERLTPAEKAELMALLRKLTDL
ncbi:MarR family winged helix-turn-helix transcriptional regulator [Aurantimonas sp. VKM B-3413]|uniref:MarR family winged helix-turn-helix transcriptional regulator n=1 Tax=Aurantimonas sp. VKM B-3413 TaxID=2779401 RepID=UPI001E5BB193|nr:MarR family transcriptional regulator [Aurantimonas sp. VKM B-3413]MCB8840405.1 MarR family transcriptional regulator [Aurantimonas sp. VKM B-3413]